jgi:hypothetical protein
MAFNRNKFLSVNGQPSGVSTLNEWKYITVDGIGELTSADYFRDVQRSLAVGDIIHLFSVADPTIGADGNRLRKTATLCVRMSDYVGNRVAALPLSPLDGMGVVKNTPFGDATAIAMEAGFTVHSAHAILSETVADDGNTIAVKNGETVLFSATVGEGTADGHLLDCEKRIDKA